MEKKETDKNSLPQPGESQKNDEFTIKQNPNPRANANVPEEDKKSDDKNTEGVGTEITDGEGG